MPSSNRPTSRDVATRAGVSVATVSIVVNGRDDGRVGAETRERVLAAARELGYAPNASARGLRRRHTERVCLVVSRIGVPAYDQLSRDVHAAADAAGYGVITMVVDSKPRAHKVFDLLQQRIADGAILAIEPDDFDEEMLHALARNGLPMVVMNNIVAPLGFDVVRTPEAEACGEALDVLLTMGRRRIAYVGHQGDLAPGSASERYGAYLEALARHGAERDPRWTVSGAEDRVAAYRAVVELLALEARPDAIFAASDRAAISAIWAIRDAGLTVPRDLAVVGVGNLDEGLITRPTLSTVGQERLNYTAVAQLLFSRVLGSKRDGYRELVLPWKFIQRKST